MKKILALLLTAVMVLGLFAGCAGSATPNETTNAPAQSDTTEASSEAAGAEQEAADTADTAEAAEESTASPAA